MGKINRFEDIEAWKAARKLNKDLFPLINKLEETRRFALKDQLERSAGSMMDNIAEGYERGGNREFIQFLSISKGSAGEVRSQLYRALDWGVINENEFNTLHQDCLSISGMTSNLMTYLSRSNLRGPKFDNRN